MPKLSAITRATKVSQAMQVFNYLLANPKSTQKKACEKFGITPDAYRFWITQSEEALNAFRLMLKEVQRSELASIISGREHVLERIIADGLNPYTDPAARLNIHKYLAEQSDDLLERQRVLDTDLAKSLLSGPELELGQSRFGASFDVTMRDDGSLNVKIKPPDIIDVTPDD